MGSIFLIRKQLILLTDEKVPRKNETKRIPFYFETLMRYIHWMHQEL